MSLEDAMDSWLDSELERREVVTSDDFGDYHNSYNDHDAISERVSDWLVDTLRDYSRMNSSNLCGLGEAFTHAIRKALSNIEADTSDHMGDEVLRPFTHDLREKLDNAAQMSVENRDRIVRMENILADIGRKMQMPA
mgnify:CR=1 FL=1